MMKFIPFALLAAVIASYRHRDPKSALIEQNLNDAKAEDLRKLYDSGAWRPL